MKEERIQDCARIRDARVKIAPRGGVKKRGARWSPVRVHICSAHAFSPAFSTKRRRLEKFRDIATPKVDFGPVFWHFGGYEGWEAGK